MLDFIYDTKFLAGAILILWYIVLFRVSTDVKFLHSEIKKLQDRLNRMEDI